MTPGGSACIRALSRRLLARAKGFVLKNSIYPGLIGDLKIASHELASEFWDHLLSRPKDAAYAEKRLGKLFELRGIDFQRRLLSKKRKVQESLDAMDHLPDDDDPERTVKTIGALRQDATPEITVENRQRFEHVYGRLQPKSAGHDETAWSANRRADLAYPSK